MSAIERRVDLQTGYVPNYQAFVRHLWSYDDPDGFTIGPPPVMYVAVFNKDDSDWSAIRGVAKTVIDEFDLGDRIVWEEVAGDRELRFRDLSALHVFCVVLGDKTRIQQDDAFVRVGEFIMWTLGFRWV